MASPIISLVLIIISSCDGDDAIHGPTLFSRFLLIIATTRDILPSDYSLVNTFFRGIMDIGPTCHRTSHYIGCTRGHNML